MPIVDIRAVGGAGAGAPIAQALADALGRVFRSAPGRTWVRLQALAAGDYAENGVRVDAGAQPVFVTVLAATRPGGAALAAEVEAVTAAVAHACGVAPQRVHVEYAPAGAGRVAFGGRLVPEPARRGATAGPCRRRPSASACPGPRCPARSRRRP